MSMRLGSLEIAKQGITTAIGSLPFRDATIAAEFALQVTPLMPAIPTLPKRSPAEGIISQAVLGIHGISLGQYGSIAIDASAVDVDDAIDTDLDSDAFVGLREFLQVASATGNFDVVKWQFVGPITLGVALHRAGLDTKTAFTLAVRAVRSHVGTVLEQVAETLPGVQQVVLLDEPSFGVLGEDDAPLGRESGVDMLSAALAMIEQKAVAGVHCCGDADWNMMLDAGPSLISLPVNVDLDPFTTRLAKFIESDGVIAWGAVRTDGPLPQTCDRAWRALTDRWRRLVDAGADLNRVVDQSIVTPACGFGLHSESATWRAMHRSS